MNLDFFLSFFHGHLKLVFSVLETIDLIGFEIHSFPQLFDFKLLAVMLHKGCLFLLLYFLESVSSHFIFKSKLADLSLKTVSLTADLLNDPIDVPLLILKLIVRFL